MSKAWSKEHRAKLRASAQMRYEREKNDIAMNNFAYFYLGLLIGIFLTLMLFIFAKAI